MDLRQYRQSTVVQAAQIWRILSPYVVEVRDVYGVLHVVEFGFIIVAEPGDWIIFSPDGETSVISSKAFDTDWEPVKGPTLT